MRVFVILLSLLFGVAGAVAQETPDPAPAAKPAPKAKAKSSSRSKAKGATPAAAAAAGTVTPGTAPAAAPGARPVSPKELQASYAAIPLAERIAIQSDLTWTGDYNGLITGEYSERMVNAVKAFQRRSVTRDTGILNPQERAALADAARPLREEVGWQIVEDPETGMRLGIPAKYAPLTVPGQSGTRWFSQQGQLHIETFVSVNTTLEAAYELQVAQRIGRRVGYQVLRDGFFVVSGMQGLKKFYVRAAVRGREVRGLAIYYDQAMEGEMEPVVIAMSSAFAPFAETTGRGNTDRGTARRKVEYGTGLVASADGHIVTDRQMVDACDAVVIPGHGNAERVAERGDLALLRIYGARRLKPASLLGPAPQGDEVTLLGIADPQAQGGGAAISTADARVGAENPRPLDSVPAPGFSGAAALDKAGRFAGLVVLKPSVVAGPTAAAQAAMVPHGAVLDFLEANFVAPASGKPGLDEARDAVVRVICVRR